MELVHFSKNPPVGKREDCQQLNIFVFGDSFFFLLGDIDLREIIIWFHVIISPIILGTLFVILILMKSPLSLSAINQMISHP
jgi:hypothetical protein